MGAAVDKKALVALSAQAGGVDHGGFTLRGGTGPADQLAEYVRAASTVGLRRGVRELLEVLQLFAAEAGAGASPVFAGHSGEVGVEDHGGPQQFVGTGFAAVDLDRVVTAVDVELGRALAGDLERSDAYRPGSSGLGG